MDIDFRWGGDPNIILSVETLVASLPIQVCKFPLKPGQKGGACFGFPTSFSSIIYI
jgi:hypothetical protein